MKKPLVDAINHRIPALDLANIRHIFTSYRYWHLLAVVIDWERMKDGDRMKHLTEKDIRVQENAIPALASQVFKAARLRALKAGSSVLEVIGEQLVESHPDGSRRVIKTIAPSTRVVAGTKRKFQINAAQ